MDKFNNAEKAEGDIFALFPTHSDTHVNGSLPSRQSDQCDMIGYPVCQTRLFNYDKPIIMLVTLSATFSEIEWQKHGNY